MDGIVKLGSAGFFKNNNVMSVEEINTNSRLKIDKDLQYRSSIEKAQNLFLSHAKQGERIR